MNHITRTQAASLNPLVSRVGAQDTMGQCAQLVQAFGHWLGSAEADSDSLKSVHLVTGAIAGALRFESSCNA